MSEPDLTKIHRTPIVEEAEGRSRPHSVVYDDPPEEEIIDMRDDAKPHGRPDGHGPKTRGAGSFEEGSRSPAYVAPIPKIGKIPPVSGPGVPSAGRPHFPRFVTASLVGKKVDEYGDVVDDDGKVLGRVAGDLPSMVGRAVLNQRGDVLGDDGELLGYVAEVESEKQRQRPGVNGHPTPEGSEATDDDSATQSMDEYMAKNRGAFRIDQRGNILDDDGNVVGSFHDFNRMGPKPDKGPRPEDAGRAPSPRNESKPSREARPNAQSHRKENESPSDIFLDVKSTTEGIQLTIRIPTVFPGGGQPKVQFS